MRWLWLGGPGRTTGAIWTAAAVCACRRLISRSLLVLVGFQEAMHMAHVAVAYVGVPCLCLLVVLLQNMYQEHYVAKKVRKRLAC
jgi:ABC-type branched-subunit amino acid transport system permease subunit